MTVQHGIRTLFIDGHDEDRRYFADRLALCSPEYLIQEATSGASGLDLCRSQTFDCVVLELVLPDMSGFEVLLQLVPRAKEPDIAVVILTKLCWPSFHGLALANGAQACLAKTRISGDDLDREIRRAIAAVAPAKEVPPGKL